MRGVERPRRPSGPRRAAPRARSSCAPRARGTTTTASRPAGGSKRVASTVGADGEAAVQRRRDVVGVALELGGEREHVGVELEEVVGGHEPGDVGGGARAQAAAERDLRPDAEGEGVGRRRAGRSRARRGCAGRARSSGRSRPRSARSPRPRAPCAARARTRTSRTPGRGSRSRRARGRGGDGASRRDPNAGLHRARRRRLAPWRGAGADRAGHESGVRRARARARGPHRGARARRRSAAPRSRSSPGESGVGKTRLVAELAAPRPRAGRPRAHRRLRRPRRRRAGLRADRRRAARPERRRAGRRGAPGSRRCSPSSTPPSATTRALAGTRVRAAARAAGAPGRRAAARARLRGRPLGRPLVARLPVLLRAQRPPRSGCCSSPPTAPTSCTAAIRCGRSWPRPSARRSSSAWRSSASRARRWWPSSTGILGRRPDARLVDELFARAEGNPFFTEELAAAATGERLPANLADALMLRVEALSPTAQTVLRLAAVAGPRVSHALLERAAGIAPDELVGRPARGGGAQRHRHRPGDRRLRLSPRAHARGAGRRPAARRARAAARVRWPARWRPIRRSRSRPAASPPSWPSTGSRPTTCRRRSRPRRRRARRRCGSPPSPRPTPTTSARSSCGTAFPRTCARPGRASSTSSAAPPRPPTWRARTTAPRRWPAAR